MYAYVEISEETTTRVPQNEEMKTKYWLVVGRNIAKKIKTENWQSIFLKYNYFFFANLHYILISIIKFHKMFS